MACLRFICQHLVARAQPAVKAAGKSSLDAEHVAAWVLLPRAGRGMSALEQNFPNCYLGANTAALTTSKYRFSSSYSTVCLASYFSAVPVRVRSQSLCDWACDDVN